MDPVQPSVGVEAYSSRSLADRWFQTLDHRQIDTGSHRWTARVVGIHTEGNEAWIQIATGRQDRDLVLHLSSWTTIDQVMAAMKTRPDQATSYPQIITAIPTI